MPTANHLRSPQTAGKAICSRENSMTGKLHNQALDQLYRAARTPNAWTEQRVTEQQLRELYDLMEFGPTSGNCCPARFVWVRSAEGKHRLAALAAPTNAPKILEAPVTVIVGYDLDFRTIADVVSRARQGHAGVLLRSPSRASHRFSQRQPSGRLSDYRGARGVGLDCGPMSGFSNEAVDSECVANTRITSNFICSHGSRSE